MLLCLQFMTHEGLYADLPVLVWAKILGIVTVHPELALHQLEHQVFVGPGGVLIDGMDHPLVKALVT